MVAGVVAVVLSIACRKSGQPRTFTVGDQRVQLEVPQGWEALDQGQQIVFRSGTAEVIMQDLGPAGAAAMRREIERAQNLWRSGRPEEARSRMMKLPIRNALFPTPDQAKEFKRSWARILYTANETPDAEVSSRFDELLAELDSIQVPKLSKLVDEILPELGYDQRREVKSRKRMRVDGREAIAVEIWMALTHTSPSRLLIVLNDGRLLALRYDREEKIASPAFDSIVANLHFPLEAASR